MKKIVLLAVLSLGGLVSAQRTGNENLEKELKNQQEEKQAKLDLYIAKYFSDNPLNKNTHSHNEENLFKNYILENEDKISFFFDGEPYFLTTTDMDQIENSNADVLQNGKLDGLNGSFNGKGIHFSVFDGGRVYEKHTHFGGPNSKRVTNKEKSSVAYNGHATGVTGMIGGESVELQTINQYGVSQPAGNAQGIAPLSTFDCYSFSNSILEGETQTKSAEQKLLGSLANISNHSYGNAIGWRLANNNGASRQWFWHGHFDPNTQNSYDLNGTYHITDKTLDKIVYNNPSMIVVKAAGNSFGSGPSGNDTKTYQRNGQTFTFKPTDKSPGRNCESNYDCIPTGALAKNIITVGATDKITKNNKRYAQASDVVKGSYSSTGPRDDGAIKPDIAGVGSNILHSTTTATGSDSWAVNGSGTSYSAPQVTGIIGLWTEINRTLFSNANLNASSAKALLIHSAQEAGTHAGPDAWFGWGFVDAKRGAEILVDKSNDKVIFEDKTLENHKINEIFLETDGKQPLKATIVWTDPEYPNISDDNDWEKIYNNRTSKLVNDLDLRITNVDTKEVYYPWRLDANNPSSAATKGDNTVDNVEQVVIDNPNQGIYKVEVLHKGNLVNNADTPAIAPQNYSIVVTGYVKKIDDYDEGKADANDTNNTSVYPSLLVGDDKEIYVKTTKNLSKVVVYDMSGRLLASENAEGFDHTLNVGYLTKGVYVIQVHLEDRNTKPVVKKILKR